MDTSKGSKKDTELERKQGVKKEEKTAMRKAMKKGERRRVVSIWKDTEQDTTLGRKWNRKGQRRHKEQD